MLWLVAVLSNVLSAFMAYQLLTLAPLSACRSAAPTQTRPEVPPLDAFLPTDPPDPHAVGGMGKERRMAGGLRKLVHSSDWAPLLPHSAGCGDGRHDLLIGVLASPSRRSRSAREVIRQTWFAFGSPGRFRVTYRFILALNESLAVPEALAVRGRAAPRLSAAADPRPCRRRPRRTSTETCCSCAPSTRTGTSSPRSTCSGAGSPTTATSRACSRRMTMRL